MKRFLRKANRGILLGGFALILLVIYIVVDYSGFSNEKPKVKETVENYIETFYGILSTNNYDKLSECINDAWSEENVVSSAYGHYDGKEYLSRCLESCKNIELKAVYGECSYKLDKLTVSKAGPGIAKVSFAYSDKIEGNIKEAYMSPFGEFYQGWYYEDVMIDSEEADDEKKDDNDKVYIYEASYEGEAYMSKIDGEWKLVQFYCWQNGSTRYEKEGE